MESRYSHSLSGQALYSADINLVADEAALADDRVIAEMFRLAPMLGSAVSRAVIPYGVSSWETAAAPTRTIVLPGTGKVTVNPFRALVGSRNLPSSGATGPLANWRDIRSAIQVGAAALAQDVSLTAMGAGSFRWDLIYAAVTIDADYVTASRKVKDGTTGNVTTATLVTQTKTIVTIGKVTGVEDGGQPALPSDAAGVYYIPLAYVSIPAGFGGATILNRDDIWEISPQVAVSTATGASSLRSASGNWSPTGAVHTRCSWTATQRPGAYMPSTISGEESLVFALDLWGGTRTKSHNSGDTIDQSRDWTKRMWSVEVSGEPSGSSPEYAWQASSTVVVPGVDNDFYRGMAQSFKGSSSSATKAPIAALTPTNLPCLAGGSTATIYVDLTTGALHVEYTGTPGCRLFCWLRATGQYVNA